MSTLDELTAKIRSVQLATLAEAVPRPEAWIYEPKWDGYRVLAFKSGGRVRLMSRRGHDWTEQFRTIADAVAKLATKECVLDGEACAIGPDGLPSFQLLQNRGRRRLRLVFFVFDLLWKDGDDLRAAPLEERRALLARVVEPARSGGVIVLSGAADGGSFRAMLDAACERGLEGIVAKQKGSRYAGGRHPTWLKVKCTLRQEFAIVGYLPLRKRERAVGGLLLALKEGDGRFHFAGKVGTGFDDEARATLASLLEMDRSPDPTAVGAPRFGGLTRWCKPRHVAEVQFTEWTDAGHVRHPSFRGLREDKTPDECVREEPARVPAPPPPPSKRVEIAGVSLSHPSRVLDPAGVTKLQLARYYEAVGAWMLPHVRGRPLTLLRWSGGKPSEKGGIFMRHGRAWGPDVLRRVPIREKTKVGEYLVVEDVAGLVALAQMDVLEVHTWNSVIEDVERPNRLVFDLDPSMEVAWPMVVRAAHEIRARLRTLGLESWPKTTGGKGLHVVAPLTPSAGWAASLAFARAFAQDMAREQPTRYVAVLSKSRRAGRVLIDYLRNSRTSTSVAAISIRARPGAPVSTPLSWDEVEPSLRPERLDMAAVISRLRSQTTDAWAGYWGRKQTLPAEVSAALRP